VDAPDPPPQPVSSGGYANPLRAVSGLTPERIDSGVDYAGVGPVYAIGNGVVLNIYAGDWPGGTFIAYQLSDGPARGLVVYTAEDLNPQVSVGSTVSANTVIGHMYGGPHGIEIGWADGSAIPNAMARSYGQYHGGNSTAFGYNFSRLLQSLGAPGGILQNNPTGTLPSGWPQW
jgi:murein DD-endopeptidase MepM/ murein hydrolase activator NlpD